MTQEGNACRFFIFEALDRYGLPISESAIRLLSMIAAHESGDFHYVRQVNGPALSLFQIEPATYGDLVDYADERDLYIANCMPVAPWRLVYDQLFAAAVARLFFLRFPEPLPDADDLHELARYAKQRWNTHLGKATPEHYLTAYLKHFSQEE